MREACARPFIPRPADRSGFLPAVRTALRLVHFRRFHAAVLWLWFLWIAGYLVVEKVDPFGLAAAATQQSRAIADRVMASFYDSDAKNHTAVVLVDDVTLNKREQPWPPSYDYYSSVLLRVALQGPKAIFLDFMFTRVRDDQEGFRRLVDAGTLVQRELKIPIFVAEVASEPCTRPEIAGFSTPAMAVWSGYGDAYPLTLRGEDTVCRQGTDPKTPAPSVAFLLYQTYCREAAGRCRPDPNVDSAAFAEPLVPRWARWAPATAPPAPGFDCPPLHGFSWARAWDALTMFSLGLVQGFGGGDAALTPCPTTLTVAEHTLRNPQVGALLGGRIVLVGSNVEASGDLTLSNIHGLLPGVYMHATALENLMDYGDRYFRNAPVLFANFTISDAAVVLFGMVLIVVQTLYLEFRRLWGLSPPNLIYASIMSFVLLGALLSMAAAFAELVRWPPSNWLSILALEIAFSAAEWWQRKLEPFGAPRSADPSPSVGDLM